jgi:predicted Zn finger-like uncharacterized protein
MRIACPSCDAEYDVPDALLAGGAKRLRCTRCGHGFTGALPESAPAPEPLPAEPEASGTASPEPGQPEAGKLEPGPPQADQLEPAKPDAGRPEAAPPEDALPKRAPPEWAPAPGASPDRPPPTRGPARHSPIDAPAEDAARPASGPLAVAWLGSLALVGGGGVALVLFQAEIAAVWPPAARLYALFGALFGPG